MGECKAGECMEKIQKVLSGYGLTFESVRSYLEQIDEQKLKALTRLHGYEYVANLLAYKYFYDNKNYREAIKLLRTEFKSVTARKNFRTIVYSLFGRQMCLNDCFINLFIEKAEEHNLEDYLIVLGIELLKKIGEKRVLSRTILAYVFYMVSRQSEKLWMLKQKDVAKIFNVTDVGLRIARKKLVEQGLAPLPP